MATPPASGLGPASKKRKLTPANNENESSLNIYQPGKIPLEDLKHWNVFRFLCPKDASILDRVQYAYVYGNGKSQTGLVVTVYSVYTVNSIDSVDNHIPSKLTLIPELCGKNVIEFYAGSKPFFLALTQKGSVFSWGANSSGRLGIGCKENCKSPLQITGSLTQKKVIQLAPSSRHVLALTEHGGIHGWGNNSKRELGLTASGSNCNKLAPIRITWGHKPFAGEKIVKIAAAEFISAVLMKSGLIFQWGYGNHMPTKVGDQIKFKQVACSQSRILALSINGSVYALSKPSPNLLMSASSKKIAINIVGDPKLEMFGIEFYHGIEIWIFDPEAEDWSFTPTHFKSMDIAFAAFSQQTYHTLKSSGLDNSTAETASLGEGIASLLNSENHYPDVTFSVEQKLIHAHKNILTVRSPYFERMFKSNWVESNQSTITIEETKFIAFNALLTYIYTDKITFLDTEYENLFDLMQLADAYCEFHIRRKCEIILLSNLTLDNACFLLKNAPSVNANELEERALNFIVDHRKQILSPLSKKDGDLGALLGQNALEKLTRAFVKQF